MSGKDKLVNARILWAGLAELEEQCRADAPFVPDFAVKREDRLLLEFRRLIREAEVEYVSSTTASELTGWDGGTLRTYARKALAAEPLPEQWSRLVVRRDGREFGFLLSTIPAKARNAA